GVARVAHGLIGEGGRYAVADAPTGPVRITVRSHATRPAGMPTRGGPPPATTAGSAAAPKEKRDGGYVAIPPRYLDPEQSGLAYTVRAGPQTHDIELKP